MSRVGPAERARLHEGASALAWTQAATSLLNGASEHVTPTRGGRRDLAA